MLEIENYFIVDIEPLISNSKKPYHLETRYKNKKERIKKDVESKRQSIIRDIKARLALQFQKVDSIVNKKKERDLLKSQDLINNFNKVQEKRNMIIQNQIINSSNIVKKAKKIAHQNNLKLSLESKNLKLKLEKQLIMSSIRKKEFLSNKYNLSKTVEIQEEAALKIQNAYRNKKFIPLFKVYKSYGISFEKSSLMKFTEITELLINVKLMKVVTFILNRAFKIGDNKNYKSPAKNFLCTYLFINFPADTIGNQSIEENKELYELSLKLIKSFENWINNVGTEKFSERLNEFNISWFDYYFNFEMWKLKDKHNLLNCMKEHHKDMTKMQQVLKAGSKKNSKELMEEVEIKSNSLKGKIIKLYGLKAFEAIDNEIELEKINLESSVTSKSIKRPSNSDMKLKELDKKVKNIYNVDSVFDKIRIIHELALNPDFKFSGLKNVDGAIKDMEKNASHKEQDGDYLEFIKIVESKLENVCKNTDTIKEIKEILDLDVLSQQINNDVCDFKNYNEFIIGWMERFCAPIRDKSLKKIRTIKDIKNQSKAILIILNEMIIDIINFEILAIKPVLTYELAQTYEKDDFQQKINKGKPMELTKTWFKNQELEGNAYANFVDNSLNLLFSQDAIGFDNCPETFELDCKRLFDFQNSIQELLVLSSLIILIKSTIKKSSYNSEVDLIKPELLKLLRNEEISLKKINRFVLDFFNEIDVKLGQEKEQLLKRMISKTINSKDPFFNIISRRLKMCCKHFIISKEMFSTDKLESYGLSCISVEIHNLAKNVEKVLSFHFKIYEEYYSGLC